MCVVANAIYRVQAESFSQIGFSSRQIFNYGSFISLHVSVSWFARFEYRSRKHTHTNNLTTTTKSTIIIQKPRKTSRPSKCQRRTDRTTMLLVAVLMLFLITEFPQGILGLLSGLMETCFFEKCYQPFGEMMDLLALINASVGFVLYGLMSKQFRTSFKSVFFNKRLSRLEMTRITNLNNTTCVWRRLNLALFIVT